MALEFKSKKDNAWFDARVVTEGRRDCRLRIKFSNFDDDEDEFIHLKSLKKLEDVDQVRSRFRKLSTQFEDSDCFRVQPGLLVCVARPVGVDELKFYDAVLTGVARKEHRVSEKGEAVCTCTFNFEWIGSGLPGSCIVDNICRVEHGTDEELDPVLISFLNKARKRIEGAVCTPLRITGGGAYNLRALHKGKNISMSGCLEGMRTKSTPLRISSKVALDPKKHHKDRSPSFSSPVEGMGTESNPLRISYEVARDPKECYKDTSTPMESLALSCYAEGMGCDASDMDEQDDMAVGGALYMVLVENLEKEISPFTILEFIQQEVSITCQASVSSSKSSELFTRAIILLDSKRNLEKLANFLESPDHLIISSTGRPWLMTEKGRFPETLRASIQTVIIFSQTPLERRDLHSNELKIVCSGSREYMEAKELQKLFKEFTEHQCGLHRRLGLEEGKISQKYR